MKARNGAALADGSGDTDKIQGTWATSLAEDTVISWP
jgi:hypothetical protein